jgi:shikimate kinase
MAITETTHSAISILNAIGTGFGGAIGINIHCKITAKVSPRQENERPVIVNSQERDDHIIIHTSVNLVKHYLNIKLPKQNKLIIKIDSEIPIAVGLKSSSAVSTGVVSAVSKLLSGRRMDAKDILRLSCKASKDSGVSITGAFDDAIASFLGGLVLTNNDRLLVLRHTRVPEDLGTIVVLRIPRKIRRYTSSLKREIYSRFKNNSMKAFELAKNGNISGAMILNSLIQCSALGYEFDHVFSAIEEGATCAGVTGKGPAIAAMCRTNKVAKQIEKRWREGAKNLHEIDVIKTKVTEPRELLTTI